MTRKEYKADWYRRNKERIRLRLLENKDAIRKKRQEYRRLNLEDCRASFRSWAKNNRQYNNDRAREWRKENPVKVKAHNDRLNKEASDKRRKDPRSGMLKAAKIRAIKKGLSFSITEKDILVPSVCPVLGIPLYVSKGRYHAGSPTIDRIDNALGYTPKNVAVISYRANSLKSDATPAELLAVAKYALDAAPHFMGK